MGKFYILIAALMLSVAATAENKIKAKSLIGEVKEKAELMKNLQEVKLNNSGKLFLRDNVVNRKAKANAPVMVNKVKRDAALPTEMITEQPAGTLYKNMYRWSYTIGTFWGYIYMTEVDGIADDVVIADDGSFYLKNPLSAVATDTWLKGKKGQGDTIEVEFPQYIYSEDYYGTTYDYYLWKLVEKTYEIDGETYADYVPDSLSQVVKFTWRNDSLVKVSDGIIGICDADTLWAGYADEQIELAKFDEPTVTPSANATVQTYSITYPYNDLLEDSYIIKVAKEGNDIYLGGLHQNMPDAWVKGTLKDGKVTFGAQYLGVDTVTLAHAFFEPAHQDSVYEPYIIDGEDYGYWYTDITLADSIAFDYDATTGIMTTDSMMIINQGNKIQNYMASFTTSVLKPWTEKAATPADPEFTEFSAYTEDNGYGYAVFLIPAKSTEGEVIDYTKMYYNIYFDDEVQTLYPDEYIYLTEEVTNIPYDFTDSYAVYTSAAEKTFYFFSTGFEKFGVQSTYTGGGEEHSSNIVYYDEAAEGIKSINGASNGTVKNTVYRDLSGRKVANPAHGLYVKTVTFADGTVKSYKVVK